MAAVLILSGVCVSAGVIGYATAAGPAPGPLSKTAHDLTMNYAAPDVVREIRETYEERLARMTAEQERLMRELEAARERRQMALDALTRTERALEETAQRLGRAGHELAELRADQTDTPTSDPGASDEDDALSAAQAELAALRLELAAAESAREGLGSTLDAFAQTMSKVIAERDDAAQRAERMDDAIGALSEEQDRRLERLEEAARISLHGMRKLFGNADLELDRILDETRSDYSGAGGPFEALGDDVGAGSGEPTEVRLAALMGDYEELNLLRFAAERLPFGRPVKGARRTSTYGPRSDPMGRGRAMHKGVDFAARRGTPIYATADGVVAFSGRQRGYGNIVILSHPFGIETRYAHLNRSRVKVGERVERGDHIADMGSTGRSTGPHLHYEVRIDREAVNPAKFIEAAHDVL